MQKDISIYDPQLITPFHFNDLIQTPKLQQQQVQEAWNHYYDEKCRFFAGNLFITAFRHFLLRDFYIYFLLPRVDIPGIFSWKTRPFTTKENSHLLAACWEYILKEGKEFNNSKNLQTKNLNTIEELIKCVADNLGYTIANMYICTEEFKITAEDRLSLSDQEKGKESAEKTTKAIPFIHYLAAHSHPNNPEQAKKERHKAFNSLVFKSRDFKEALEVRAPNGVTVADIALMYGHYDVYEMLKDFRGATPALSQLFIAKNFAEDKKNDLNPFSYAKTKKDFALMNALLQLPGCEPILKIRAAEDGLTLLEWAAIKGDYPLVAEIYRRDPFGIGLALSMAGKQAIKKLYFDSLKNKFTHDTQLRDLLHCYVTEYPGVIDDMQNQTGYLLGLIRDEKINQEGLKLILNCHKEIAISLKKHNKLLPPAIQHFLTQWSAQWSAENNTLLGWLWPKKLDDEKLSPKIAASYESRLALPIFSDMKFHYLQEPKPLPLIVREAITKAKKLPEIKSSMEFCYALLLSGSQDTLRDIIDGSTIFNLDLEFCIEEDLSPKRNLVITNLISAILKGEIDIQSVLVGTSDNVKRIRKMLCQFICDQKPEENNEIIRCSLNQNHPMRKLWDEDSLKKFLEKRRNLCDYFVKEAKEIFIRIIKNTPYFPDYKEGDEQKKQDDSHFLLINILRYRQTDIEEGADISTLPIYLFFNPDKLPRYLNSEQIKNLKELDAKTQNYHLEIKYQVKHEQKLVERFNAQREIYLNNLKALLSPFEFNFILGKILICNQALRILSHPTARVSLDLLHTWKKSFPQNVFNDSYSLEGLVKELIKLRIDQSIDQNEEEKYEEEGCVPPPPFNPDLPPSPPPAFNPYLPQPLVEPDLDSEPGSQPEDDLEGSAEGVADQEVKHLPLPSAPPGNSQPAQDVKNSRPLAYNPGFLPPPPPMNPTLEEALNENDFEPGLQSARNLSFLPLPPNVFNQPELDVEPGSQPNLRGFLNGFPG